jgi:hypothetical protein
MIPYILHVTVITTICYFFYKLLLQKETFYRWNRWMLVGCLALAFLLPLLPAPRIGSLWVKQDIAVEALPVSVTESKPVEADARQLVDIPSDEVATPELSVIRPVVSEQPSVKPGWMATAAALAVRWVFYIYLFGVLVFGLNFLLQLGILLYQSYTSPVIRDGRFRIVETGGNRAPCSFGNTIFINPAGYDWETYNQILIHEKTHVSGRHTVDILLAEVAVVCQWFNPVVWLYRREVENNLEFLTDAAVLRHGEVERLAYQLSLLRVSAPHLPFSITNNYNQSLLKRRIVMMNSSNSSTWTVWKYFFLLPVFTALVLLMNKPAAYSQEPSKNDRLVAPVPPVTVVATVPAIAAAPVTVVAPVRRIAAKATVVSPAVPAPVVVPAIAPVAAPVPVPAEAAQPSDTLTEGAWFVTTSDSKLSFELKADDNDENHFWSSTLRVGKDEINPFPGAGNVSFRLVRDAGTMLFTGQFDGQQGFGHFHFQADEGYFRALQQMGVEDLEGRRQLSFFMANVRKEFADMVVHSGYPHISGRMLISFSALHIDRDFIQYWRSSGLQDAEEPRTLITLKAQNIDKAYVEEMKAAGYDHLSARELNTLKAQHITGSYVRSIGRGKDNQLIPVRELVSYKAMNIDSGYINSLRKLGYTSLERRDIVMLYNMHVTADYIRSLQDMGFRDLAPREIVQMKSQEVSPEFLKGFRDAGLTGLSPRELVQLKVTGVGPEFIKGFQNLGYRDISPSRLSMLKATGVTPDFVSEFRKIGFDDIPLSVLPSLKSMGVNAEWVSKMKEKGFVSKDLNKYIRLKNDFN